MPGAGGAAVTLNTHNLTESERAEVKAGRDLYHHNEFVSKQISIYRDLPYCWTKACQQFVTRELQNLTLPQISVIIIFNNEAWTPLLRSIHSVLERTDPSVLREVIVVDDKSSLVHLQAPLEKYFKKYSKVKIVRLPKRMGLINARMMGVRYATAPVLVFLDAHIECFKGWSESMLIRIARNPRAVVYPIIEGIDSESFQVSCTSSTMFFGTFEWKNLNFNWIKIPKREFQRRENEADSFRSPTMPGGLFAITKQFFEHLGTYDTEMLFWGGENIELSFKTWMCGGSLELDPCSHVGHVFRKGVAAHGSIHQTYLNSLRVAEVWMDDYKNYFYERSRYRIEKENTIDVADRQILRQNLDCKDFAWYLENIFPEKTIPSCVKYSGEESKFILHVPSHQCLDVVVNSSLIQLSDCADATSTQRWEMGLRRPDIKFPMPEHLKSSLPCLL
ncbi:polypeptide n-acetylgalactosaminyltransferase [Plakobranchus ocellatus]|uniref:Polypeptide N-acetylgalactosaminyltransferase n=1 Tax=Plakobranchus ocellatus TaxID=259542 RepID=A0AAV4AE03_9GAST|nr:polypeptide n-acetylgalactosaminyltransferase [Plakobranchus ocellatus]